MDPLRLGQTAARFARTRLSRRAALASGGAGLAGAFLGSGGPARTHPAVQDATPAAEPGAALPPNVPEWMRHPGAPASPYGERSPYQEAVLRFAPNPVASFAPLADLYGILTPNALFYEIHHAGIPAIDPAAHRLLIHGMVERPTLLTMDDLKRFPAVSVIHFLECSGNRSEERRVGKGCRCARAPWREGRERR